LENNSVGLSSTMRFASAGTNVRITFLVLGSHRLGENTRVL